MRKVKVQALTPATFRPFGFYARHLNPSGEKLGAPPVEFFRDMVQQPLGGFGAVSFSTCRVEKRPLVIDATEFHSLTSEGLLPLDNDILIHVGPAVPTKNDVPLDKFRVFRVPRGTMVVLRPGIWHHAPFTVNRQPANVLIVFPERTYANDCQVVNLSEAEQIKIEG